MAENENPIMTVFRGVQQEAESAQVHRELGECDHALRILRRASRWAHRYGTPEAHGELERRILAICARVEGVVLEGLTPPEES